VRLLRYGASGLLIELPSSAAWPRRTGPCGRGSRRSTARLVELVPARATVLVEAARRPAPVDLVRGLISEAAAGQPGEGADPDSGARPTEVVIPVHYDGADLELVARTAELSVVEVIELHSSAEYTVAFCGFPPDRIPDRAARAAAASQAGRLPAQCAGRLGGPGRRVHRVYPRSSPGGWRLLGHTDEVHVRPGGQPTSQAGPGRPVRFKPVD